MTGKTEERSEGLFDRVAAWSGKQVERPWFFAVCFAFVVGWCVALPFQGFDNDLWHLTLNSPTTAITFLLVALLQNTSSRSTKAMQHKLDVALEALAEVLDNTDGVDQSGETAQCLRDIAGVEMEPTET